VIRILVVCALETCVGVGGVFLCRCVCVCVTSWSVYVTAYPTRRSTHLVVVECGTERRRVGVPRLAQQLVEVGQKRVTQPHRRSHGWRGVRVHPGRSDGSVRVPRVNREARVEDSVLGPAHLSGAGASALAFTGYCYYQYCLVYGIQKRGRGGGLPLRRSRAILLQQCGNYRWGGHEMMIGSFTKALK